MAYLDGDRNAVVIRVVYDGPPRSGKTTTIRTLNKLLAERRTSGVFSPGEATGRTLYFDWMEYEGGVLDGRRVWCQIVTVPGQQALAKRRELLLTAADVIVFVANCERQQLATVSECFQRLLPQLKRPGEPPLGVVVQANKQDLQDAVSGEELRSCLEASAPGDPRPASRPRLGIVESTAINGAGIREAFVFAVRLALDRVREQIKEHELPIRKTEADKGMALLADIREAEGDSSQHQNIGAVATAVLNAISTRSEAPTPATTSRPPAATRPATRPATAPGVPRLPDSEVAFGLVWPPVHGRLMLRELEQVRGELRLRSDAWMLKDSKLRAVSFHTHSYDRLDQGRQAFLLCARQHAQHLRLLSEPRCLAMEETGHHEWRIWQVMAIERTLGDELEDALSDPEPARLAAGLLAVAQRLSQAAASLSAAPIPLPVRLNTIGLSDRGEPIFIEAIDDAVDPTARDLDRLLRDELAAPLDTLLESQPQKAQGALRQLMAQRTLQPTATPLIETLSTLLTPRDGRQH
jgi:signal recognition particle receptor subunit beta